MIIAMARPSAAPHSAGFSSRRSASSGAEAPAEDDADADTSAAVSANAAHTASSPSRARADALPSSSPAFETVPEPVSAVSEDAVAFASSASFVTLASALRRSAPETQARRSLVSAAIWSKDGSAAARSAAISMAAA